MPARYLVGYDGSPHSERALAWAARRARADGGVVTIATAIPESIKDSFFSTMLLPNIDLSTIVPSGSFERNAQARLEAAAKATGLDPRTVETLVLKGEAWHALIEAARKLEPEAIVIGVKSYEKLAEFQLGASAERIVRHAPCSVVVVR